MRASPACQVPLQPAAAWRVGVCALALVAVAGLLAWGCAWWPDDEAPAARWRWAAIAAACALIGALGASLWRIPGQVLAWDGREWRLDGRSGEIRVAIDLGPWMLLAFTPHPRRRRERPAARWLPLQRGGAGDWHALRCAVHAPRPAE